MSNFWTIFKVMVRTDSISNQFSKSRRNTKNSRVTSIIMTILVFSIIFGAMLFSCYPTFITGKELGLTYEVLVPQLLLSFILLFGFTFISSFSSFFLNSDSEVYLPFPIKPTVYYSAKFAVVYAHCLCYCFFTAFPVMLMYFIIFGCTVVNVIGLVVAVFFLSIIPSALAFFLGNFLVFCTPLGKNKTALSIVVSIISYTLMIGSIVIITMLPTMSGSSVEMGSDSTTQTLDNLLNLYNTVKPISFLVYFPQIALISSDMGTSGLNSLFMVLILIGVVGLQVLLANLVYIKNLSKLVGGPKRKKENFDTSMKEIKNSSELGIFVKRELKMIFRNATTLVQSVLPYFLFPIIFTISFQSSMPALSKESSEFEIGLINNIMLPIIVMICYSIPSLCSIAISKEKDDLEMLKTLPFRYRNYMISKLVPSLSLSVICSLIIIIVNGILVKMSPGILIMGFFLSISFSFFITLFDLKRELDKPMLNWQNDLQYHKRVLVSLPHIGIALLALAIGGISIGLAYAFVNITMVYIAYLIQIAVYLTLAYILFRNLDKTFEAKFNKLIAD